MNAGAIIAATLLVAAVGLFIGVFLGIAGKKFAVETDEREVKVREALPGNNCGGCGYPGCDGLAAAIKRLSCRRGCRGESDRGDHGTGGCGNRASDSLCKMQRHMYESERKLCVHRCAGLRDDGVCAGRRRKGVYIRVSWLWKLRKGVSL